ncbi:hypothetical protein KKA57_02890 [Patescibacteria group bacterium]|nr:hypothetical protein [Patescibacteria group bacterium]
MRSSCSCCGWARLADQGALGHAHPAVLEDRADQGIAHDVDHGLRDEDPSRARVVIIDLLPDPTVKIRITLVVDENEMPVIGQIFELHLRFSGHCAHPFKKKVTLLLMIGQLKNRLIKPDSNIDSF